MTNPPNTLAAVVQDFVTSLSAERQVELKAVLLNYQFTTSWLWYKEVIDRYLTGSDAKAVLADIEMHYPGAEFYNGIEQAKLPVYEAEVILQRAQKAIGK